MQIVYGDAGTFDDLVYGTRIHPGTMNYMQQQVDNVMEMSRTLADAGKSFFADARSVFNEFNGSEAMRRARAAVRKVGSLFQRNEVVELTEIGRIQNAPQVMQRFIMAEPTVRRAFHAQRIDGYSDSYVDIHKQDIGITHPDYRKVISGVMMDDDEYDTKTTLCFDDDGDDLDDPPLAIDQKADILSTWDATRHLLELGDEDPTSIFGNKL